jgi:predicted transcriptional regulator
MENSEGLDTLFYELASESRLKILQELQINNLRMKELAQKIDVTDTEAFRQLQRLSQALLIQKQPDSAYSITEGELSQAMLSTDAIEMVNNAEQLILGAEKHLWLIGERPLSFLGGKVTEMVKRGVTVRLLFDESCRKFYENMPELKDVFEKRVIEDIPAILVINEKFAGINILSIDGRGDNAIFYGKDSKILKWANDLFIYYWEQGKRCYPT